MLINGIEFLKSEAHVIPPLRRESRVLPKGSVHGEGAKPLECDILFERDVPVKMRDGVTIYTDIFRPVTEEAVPGIVAWSPYGKDKHRLDIPWFVAAEKLSNLQKFEGPDPGYWCAKGYAVLQPDARGVGNSEGNVWHWGVDEGKDVYDLIEWAGVQPWCNGSIGMAGTSWLGLIQWHAAVLNPPHLKAIAPWDGGDADSYRHTFARGGIMNTVFDRGIFKLMVLSDSYYESMSDMGDRYPLYNDYWRSRHAAVDQINIPIYQSGGYTNAVHVEGTFDTWCELKTPNRWLRIHNDYEWEDLYAHQDDLCRFFDRYLKGTENGWEATPRVRMAVLDPEQHDIVDPPEEDFPPPRTQYRTLYANALNGTFSPELPQTVSQRAYNSEDHQDMAVFSAAFGEKTELSGYVKLTLWMAAESAEDMDIFAYYRKVGPDGQPICPIVKGAIESGPDGAPFFGPTGWLKASLRKVEEYRTGGMRMFRPFDRPEMLEPGVPVKLEIAFAPMGMIYYPGEQLQVMITGYPLNPSDAACPLDPDGPQFESCNRGRHIIFTGGEYDSGLIIPVIP